MLPKLPTLGLHNFHCTKCAFTGTCTPKKCTLVEKQKKAQQEEQRIMREDLKRYRKEQDKKYKDAVQWQSVVKSVSLQADATENMREALKIKDPEFKRVIIESAHNFQQEANELFEPILQKRGRKSVFDDDPKYQALVDDYMNSEHIGKPISDPSVRVLFNKHYTKATTKSREYQCFKALTWRMSTSDTRAFNPDAAQACIAFSNKNVHGFQPGMAHKLHALKKDQSKKSVQFSLTPSQSTRTEKKEQESESEKEQEQESFQDSEYGSETSSSHEDENEDIQNEDVPMLPQNSELLAKIAMLEEKLAAAESDISTLKKMNETSQLMYTNMLDRLDEMEKKYQARYEKTRKAVNTNAQVARGFTQKVCILAAVVNNAIHECVPQGIISEKLGQQAARGCKLIQDLAELQHPIQTKK